MTTNSKKNHKEKKMVGVLGVKDRLREATPEERREIIDGLPHEVGFAKPPQHTRFQKGQSGNPKGRKRGARDLRTIIVDALEQPIIVTNGGKRKAMPSVEVIVRQCVHGAAGGDAKARQALLEMARRAGLFDVKPEQADEPLSPQLIEIAGAVIAAFQPSSKADERERQ